MIHLGMVFLFVGLAGNLFKAEHTLTLQPGHPVTVGAISCCSKA